MESVSAGEDCLEEKKGDTEQEPAKKPSKKKKKKKKKNKNSSVEVEASGSAELLTEESVSNVEETQQTDCKTIAEEKPEIDAQHGDEKDSSEDEGSTLLYNKDELKQHDVVGNVTDEKKPPNSSSEDKSRKKRKKKKKNPTLDNVLAEEKEIKLVIPPEEVDKSDYTHEKRSDNGETTSSSETPDLVPQKPCDEEKSYSPVINRKKKKNKKAGGFLLSDLDLTKPQNDSDKEKDDGKVVAEKQGKKLCDKNVTAIPAERESDLAALTHDKSLLKLETREKNNFFKILIITNELGLETLRRVFKQIHPSWSNKPDDAKNLVKGKMKLQKHELARFNTGDINSWDISLITTVLLYSKKCVKELTLKPGFEDAIRTIKDQKNQLISHMNSERITNDKFNIAWGKISKSLETLGVSCEAIEEILTEDDILQSAKYYRDMLFKEVALNSAVQSEVKCMHEKVQDIHADMQNIGDKVEKVFSLISQSNSASEDSPLQDVNDQKWDEWIRFRDSVKRFDHQKNNYILITDAMSPENLKHLSVLRNVPWKVVLDFNPASEEKGMYHNFVKKGGKNCLIDMITPDEIQSKHASTINLARHIDPRKTQWLFVREREKDNCANGGVRSFEEWKSQSVKHLYRFLSCCSDPEKIDSHKPVICVVLPFREETRPFLKATLKKLMENFNEFSLRFVGIKHQHIGDFQVRFDMHLTDLSPDLLNKGLRGLLQCSSGKEYSLPTCQAQMPAKLKENELLFLQEYIDVLYDGCEGVPSKNEEEKFAKFKNEHRESFLSGNWISFVSLKYEHDAQRELGREVRNHIQRLLDQGQTHSTIVEIHHLPGTGGSTIARRVLWELHYSYPCAIAKLDDYKHYDIDDDNFINALAERIGEVQEICQVNPLILLDGKHARIEALSKKLVRNLNIRGQRAVLLSCLHRSAKADDKETNPETSDVHQRFFVNVKLEDSSADLHQFEEKYRDYIDTFKKTKAPTPSRVFHFPLLAMLKGLAGFGTKLKQIIHESFDDMEGLQKEIAVVVAFIKNYAAQETPACLLYKAFKKYVRKGDQKKGITYEDINQLITEQLLNLMVPARPRRHPRQTQHSSAPESYSLQHPLVAKLVLQRYYTTQKCNIFTLTFQFLEFPIFQDDRFFSLVNDLFIRNKSSLPKSRFAILVEELKSQDPDTAAQVFCCLAEKTGDAIVFAHAARFNAKKHPPSFQVATDLIARAFQCKNFQAKRRIIYDMQGVILHDKLKSKSEKRKISSIEMLEGEADGALRAFKNARNWPPTFASPLIGEVKVWIACIEWITKHECNGDTDKAFEFITSKAPPFFHTCIGDSFRLLDIVDSIVQKEQSLPEPEETQKLGNTLRLSLLSTFNKGKIPGRREKDREIIRECTALCSVDKFPKCSQAELKRLQVYYILASVDPLETLKKEHIEFLLKLLEDLVLTTTQSSGCYMACHLMRVSLLITGPKQYSLDKGLQITDKWINESSHDPMPYFYKMMIYFIKILEGCQIMYRDKYNKAVEMCKEKSQNHCRGLISTHFLKKSGEGMNRLMTRSTLLTGEPEYPKNITDFWTSHSRKKLLECCGRIRIRPGRRRQVCIELVQGNIELYVGKNANIGKVERDYSNGTMVYFVVSFNLKGPVANGITFKPKDISTK